MFYYLLLLSMFTQAHFRCYIYVCCEIYIFVPFLSLFAVCSTVTHSLSLDGTIFSVIAKFFLLSFGVFLSLSLSLLFHFFLLSSVFLFCVCLCVFNLNFVQEILYSNAVSTVQQRELGSGFKLANCGIYLQNALLDVRFSCAAIVGSLSWM